MKSVINIEENEYGAVLDNYQFPFTENDSWLEVGDCYPLDRCLVYVSVLLSDVHLMLQAVLPVLKDYRQPFRLLKNSRLIDRNNGLWQGPSEAGKVLTICTTEPEIAIDLCKVLESKTNHLKGQIIYNTLRVGKVLYAAYCEKAPTKLESFDDAKLPVIITPPDLNRFPFEIASKYLPKPNTGKINNRFIYYDRLKFNPKGDIYLGADMKRLSFAPVIIKQARSDSFSDKKGRTSRDRLYHEMAVLKSLQGKTRIPKLYGLYEQENDYYLVIQRIMGVTLWEKVEELRAGKAWNELDHVTKQRLVSYYQQAVSIVAAIHANGYIHRDIQPNNFIVNDKDELYIIDFELAYDFVNDNPNPAFTLGTFGFVAPEQQVGLKPTSAEDAYSLGALLAFILLLPKRLKEFQGNLFQRLVDIDADSNYLDIISACLARDPNKRMPVSNIAAKMENDVIVEPTPYKNWFISMATYLYITMFMYAAVSKWMMFNVFVSQMNKQPFDDSYTPLLVFGIPSLEIISSILMITPKLSHWGLRMATGMMIIFTSYIVLIQLKYFGTIPCSCGGAISELTWMQHLFFNLFFVIAGVVAVVIQYKRKHSFQIVSLQPKHGIGTETRNKLIYQ